MSRSLKEATKDLHHAAEQHPIGASMADGSIPQEWWADWLLALFTVHLVLDPHLASCLHRTEALFKDLEESPVVPKLTWAAVEYAQSLDDPLNRVGATYVFTGAHLMGGAITAKAVGDRVPTHHLQWEDRSEAVKEWSPLRDHSAIEPQAIAGFKAVMKILEEIYANRGAAGS